MTEIEFHFNAPDKLSYACRLLRKASASGKRTVVTAAPDMLEELDRALWTFSALDFVAHCHSNAAPAMVAASPVVLAEALAGTPAHPVAVNLGEGVPAGFEKFERLIEVVTNDNADRQQARLRWKHYAQRGYDIQRRDLAGPAA
ncbi:MAG: DNA polymerase III subunit chi [Pseudomonadota bacterium]